MSSEPKAGSDSTTTRCWSCQAEVAPDARFCSACGTGLGDLSATPTSTAPRPSSGSSRRRLAKGSALPFVPGMLLAGRFRLIGLLGKGGMGEVYRADDLKLGQTVALKFLPARLAADPGRMERFLGEVRIARQLAHPYVCRVYEIFEADSYHFLSMEYIDGEDLASLSRRIGRLPRRKAVEAAHQLSLGLHAAHERGVLHRDLKPENIMLDAQGSVRITDFGLSALADEVGADDARSGTPAYMSPEQLAGTAVTSRSDIYSLGVVLFEMFVGRKPFEARSVAEYARLHRETPAPLPSAFVPDLDPAIERVILWCLEKDPLRRPASALAVAAALPGGDPLAAAMAAGETPAPELVAAAGAAGALRPVWAWLALLATLAGLASVPCAQREATLAGLVPLDRPAGSLAFRAREIVDRLAPGLEPTSTAVGFTQDIEYIQYVAAHDLSPSRWRRLGSERNPAVQLWYRQSPQPMVAIHELGRVDLARPPMDVAGMATVQVDVQGRLAYLEVVPPQIDEPAEVLTPNWAPVFEHAGLDLALFRPVVSRWTSPHFSDVRVAWEGYYPDRPGIPMRIEAAAYRGRPVYFEVVGPWTRPRRAQPFEPATGQRVTQALSILLFLAITLLALLLARRNVRRGRGDRRGATRLAVAALLLVMLTWGLFAQHVPDVRIELLLFFRGLGAALRLAGILWLLYVAIEPSIRRRWPDTIISWTRLLGGQWRDPLVGRDILLGALCGTYGALLACVLWRLPGVFGWPAPIPTSTTWSVLLGQGRLVGTLTLAAIEATESGMALLALLVFLRSLVRQKLVAGFIGALISAALPAFSAGIPFVVSLLLFFAGLVLPVAVLLRLGLLPFIVCLFFMDVMASLPLAAPIFSAQPALPATVFALAAGLVLLAFKGALAGRPAFGRALLAD